MKYVVWNLALCALFWGGGRGELGAQSREKEWTLQSRMQTSSTQGLMRESLVGRREWAALQLDFVRFDAGAFELLVIDNGTDRAKPAYASLGSALQALGCVAGANGGFFDEIRFKPDGLQIAGGVWTGVFDPKHGSRGVFVVRGGIPSLEMCDNCPVGVSVQHLLQSGPVLVWKKTPTDTLNDSNVNRRTFLAWDGKTGWMLGQASRCGLQQLSAFLASPAFAEIFSLQDALNLDGGPSSGLWISNGEGKEPFYLREHSIVRNFVGIRPKSGNGASLAKEMKTPSE